MQHPFIRDEPMKGIWYPTPDDLIPLPPDYTRRFDVPPPPSALPHTPPASQSVSNLPLAQQEYVSSLFLNFFLSLPFLSVPFRSFPHLSTLGTPSAISCDVKPAVVPWSVGFSLKLEDRKETIHSVYSKPVTISSFGASRLPDCTLQSLRRRWSTDSLKILTSWIAYTSVHSFCAGQQYCLDSSTGSIQAFQPQFLWKGRKSDAYIQSANQ